MCLDEFTLVSCVMLQGKFQGLDLNEELHVGGYPNYTQLAKTADIKTGFVGERPAHVPTVPFKHWDCTACYWTRPLSVCLSVCVWVWTNPLMLCAAV